MFIKNEQGQLTILMALIVPVLFALVAFLVNYFYLVDTKMKLQVAADRAVFAGAAKLAYSMNQIAEENWAVYKAYRKVWGNFDKNSQSGNECPQRVKEMDNTQQTAWRQNIEDIVTNAYGDAIAVANSVMAANFPETDGHTAAVYDSIYGKQDDRLFEMVDDLNSDQKNDVICGIIEGVVFAPKEVKEDTQENKLKYLFLDQGFVALVGRLTAQVYPLLMKDIFGPEGITINATAAAQPYGGSMKNFALQETDTIEQARNAAAEGVEAGKPYLFRPALVPVRAVIGEMDLGDGIYAH